jgi:hypothetical protein
LRSRQILGVFFALALALVSMGTQPAQATHLKWYSYATTTARLNLRTGPGTGYNLITTIPEGARVYVRYRVSGTHWYKVTYGSTGYAYGAYLTQGSTSSSGSGGGGALSNLGFGYADGNRVDRMIGRIRPYSPLRGYGWTIANAGHYWGVDPLLVAQWAYETELATTGVNSPTNPGNMTWEAAKPYAYKYGCYRGAYTAGRYWARCPSISAGIKLWFNYVGVRYRGYSLYGYFNTYNPCWDPYNTGQLCGSRYGDATLSLIRRYS